MHLADPGVAGHRWAGQLTGTQSCRNDRPWGCVEPWADGGGRAESAQDDALGNYLLKLLAISS